MPYRIDTLGGRVIVLGTLVAGLTVFALWFTGVGPFGGPPPPPTGPRSGVSDPLVRHGTAPVGPPARYPDLEATRDPLRDPRPSPGPDFDPLDRPGGGPSRARPLWELLRLLPEGTSVLGMVRVEAMRRVGWADDLLSGRKLPHLLGALSPLGLDLQGVTRAVFGVELEARPAPAPSEGKDPRFHGRLDRPFALVVEGDVDRKALLQRFRREGPLAATVMMGRRIYRRAGDYSLTFPVQGLTAWTYRRPMGPLLTTMLEDASRTALGPSLRQLAGELGLLRLPPRSGPREPARRAPPLLPSREPGRRPEPRRTAPGAGPASAPDRSAPHAAPAPDRSAPRPAPIVLASPDRDLPWIALLWTPQPGQRIPYPMNRLGGYGAKSALRGAVVTLGPVPGGEDRVLVELRLVYRDAQTPVHMATLLRYVRRYVSALPRVRRANLGDLVDGVPVQVKGAQIVVPLELRIWHVRSLLLLFHKLLETGG